MVVAGPEGFIKNSYRKFNIKTEGAAGDDFAMMREVLTRRFGRALKENPERDEEHWPDLVLIDGGQGQLEVARQVLTELGLEDIAIVGIAKGPDRDAGRERFFVPGKPPFSLEPRDPVLYFLQRLRDEAHRFAIGTHRTRRAADITRSALDEVPGIGAAASARCCTISAAPVRLARRRSRTSSRCRESPARSPRKSMTTSAAADKVGSDAEHFANILTLSRIAAIPLVVACFWLDTRLVAVAVDGAVRRSPASPTSSTAISRGAITRSRGSAASSIRSPTSCWSPRRC